MTKIFFHILKKSNIRVLAENFQETGEATKYLNFKNTLKFQEIGEFSIV